MTSAAKINLTEAYTGQQTAYHRGPHEAGAANRYYGQSYKPNFAFNGITFAEHEMTEEQIVLYKQGWDSETDRKKW